MLNNLSLLYNFFSKKHRHKIFYIQIIVIISSLLEVSIIFLIAPIINILSNNIPIDDTSNLFHQIYNFFEFENYNSFLMLILSALMVIMLISTCIILLSLYIFTKFAYELGNIIRTEIYNYFILQPWVFHSQNENSMYLNKINHESARISSGVILQFLLANSKIFTAITIIIGLIIYNTYVTVLCLIVFSVSYYSIFKFFKIKLINSGIIVTTAQQKILKTINESFEGIREIIVYGRQKIFSNKFYSSSHNYAEAERTITWLGLVPRYILELIAFIVILISIFIFLLKNESETLISSLPILATYAFAGYKLLPIFQQIYTSISLIRSNTNAIDSVSKELSEISKSYLKFHDDQSFEKKLYVKNKITFKNVTLKYENGKKNAIKNINLELKNNSLVCLVGPSGSGKTTFLDIFLGLLDPQEGFVEIDNNKINSLKLRDWQNNISFVNQNIFLLNDTIKNNICFGHDESKFDQIKFDNALISSDVSTFLKDMKEGLDTIVGERGIRLSGGQRQRIAIARALYHDKQIIVFDEATISLDGISERFIIEKIKELSKTKLVLMVTHNLRLTKIANKIYLLNNGELIKSGSFEELKDNEIFNKLLNE